VQKTEKAQTKLNEKETRKKNFRYLVNTKKNSYFKI